MEYRINASWVLSFFLLASSVASDFTWWADDSCLQKFGDDGTILGKMVKESSENYGYGRDHLSRTYPEEPHAWNNWIDMLRTESLKQTPMFDSSKAQFLDAITNAAKYVKEGEQNQERARKLSEIRIYCDNQSPNRVKLVPDDKTMYKDLPENTPLNSLRPEADQEWEDVLNKVRGRGAPSCRKTPTPDRTILGSAMSLVLEADPEQNQYRMVITLCDAWFSHPHRFNTWEELDALAPQGFLLPGQDGIYDIEKFRTIGSQLISHELAHGSRFGCIDYGYTWDEMMSLTPNQAIFNAETYASFAGIMKAMEKKYTLEVDEQYQPTGGWLVYDSSIPARVSAKPKMKKSDLCTCKTGIIGGAAKGLVCKEFMG